MDSAHLREAVGHYLDLVAAIGPDAWTGPGLGGWDLRALVGHASRSLVTVRDYLDRPAETVAHADAASYYAAIATTRYDPDAVLERGRQAGRDLGPEPAGFLAELAQRTLPLLERDDDPVITTIAGGMRLSAYLPTRTTELVVHSLDIAAATEQPDPPFSPGLTREVLDVLAGAAALRGTGPLLLRALTGRGTLPAGFSLV